MEYGMLCLVPPAAMLLFALKTKKSFAALIFGTLIAYIIMYQANFIEPWCDLLLSEISNADNQYILLLCGLFGGFIFLLREAKGTMGFSALLSRFCKSERMVMLTSVFMGIIIFVDVYLNIMTVGTCMILYLPRKKMTFTRYVELFFAGFADILPVLAILLASFMIKTACGEMGLSEYVINLCVPYMNDATVLSSATCEIDNMSHAVSQLPYVLISAILATAGFLIAGIMGL